MYLEDPKEEPEVIFQAKKKKAKWTSKCMKSHGFGSITCSPRHPHCHMVQAEKRRAEKSAEGAEEPDVKLCPGLVDTKAVSLEKSGLSPAAMLISAKLRTRLATLDETTMKIVLTWLYQHKQLIFLSPAGSPFV